MKLTESQLRRIIREELEKTTRLSYPRKGQRTNHHMIPDETRSEFYLTDEFNDDDAGLWMMDDKTPYAIDYSEDVLDDPNTVRMGKRMQEGRFSGKDSWSKVPKVGSIYKVGYGRHVWESRFEGWTIENNEPYMNWTDMKNGDSWSAYIYDGVVSVGSSADPLLIHKEVM